MSEKIGVLLEMSGVGLTDGTSELLVLARKLAKADELKSENIASNKLEDIASNKLEDIASDKLEDIASDKLENKSQDKSQNKIELDAFIGNLGKANLEDLAKLPVSKVYYGTAPILAATLANAMVNAGSYDLFLTAMTVEGRELGAYLALLTGGEYIGGISGIKPVAAGWQLTKLVAEGLSQATKVYPKTAKLVLGIVPELWGGALVLNQADKGEAATVLPLQLATDFQNRLDFRGKVEREYLADWQEIDVNEANLVIAGGNGMHNQAAFNKLYELGESLAAPVGGSRVAEDKAWISHEKMIGATGKTIAPQVYLACGISGAIQHLVGMQGAKKVVAINTDPLCAMMTGADLAVQGDSLEVVSVLVEALKPYTLKQEV